MGISVMRSELVKPSEATPQGPFWLSNLDLGVRSGYSPTIYLFRPHGPGTFFSVDVLRTALAKALVPFYPLAGRLGTAPDGRLEIDCNAEGAVFVVAQSDAVLEDLEEGFSPASKAMRDLFVPPYPKEAGPGSPLLLLQVTLLRGGGVVLGTGMHHYALDGRSSFHFIQTWSSIARTGITGAAIEAPFLDRISLRARSPPVVLFDHSHEYLASSSPTTANNNNNNNNNKASTELAGAILRVSSAHAAALWARTGGESLFRTLVSHIWRCACKARELPHDAKSRLYTVVDMRARLAPPLPGAFLGNAGARTSVAAKVGDLVAGPLSFGARRLRVATGKGDDYARSLVDYLETVMASGSGSGPGRELPDTDLRVISWMGMASHDADFGWGAPVLVAPAAMSYTWFVYSVGDGTGDVAVAVAMKEEDQLERFKELFFDEKEMAAWPDACESVGEMKAF